MFCSRNFVTLTVTTFFFILLVIVKMLVLKVMIMVFSSEMYGYGYGYGMVWYCMGKTSACAKPEGGGHLVVQVRQRKVKVKKVKGTK